MEGVIGSIVSKIDTVMIVMTVLILKYDDCDDTFLSLSATIVDQGLTYFIIYDTRSLGALWAPTSSWRPFGLLDLSFAPFGRSGQVTHASYIAYR